MPSFVTCHSDNCEHCLSNLCMKDDIELSENGKCLNYRYKEYVKKELMQCWSCKNYGLFSTTGNIYKAYCNNGYRTNNLIGNSCWEDK